MIINLVNTTERQSSLSSVMYKLIALYPNISWNIAKSVNSDAHINIICKQSDDDNIESYVARYGCLEPRGGTILYYSIPVNLSIPATNTLFLEDIDFLVKNGNLIKNWLQLPDIQSGVNHTLSINRPIGLALRAYKNALGNPVLAIATDNSIVLLTDKNQIYSLLERIFSATMERITVLNANLFAREIYNLFGIDGIKLIWDKLYDCSLAHFIYYGFPLYNESNYLMKFIGIDADVSTHSYRVLAQEAWAALCLRKNRLDPLISKLSLNPQYYPQIHNLGIAIALLAITGFPISLEKIKELETEYAAKQDELILKIIQDIPKMRNYIKQHPSFNINSPIQLLHCLKTLGYNLNSTSETELVRYINDDLIDLILQYRKVNKLLNTFLKPLYQYKSSRIHSVFSYTGTNTGRISSANPNVHNFPEIILKAIVKPSKELYVIDYSQLEFRVMAYITNNLELLEHFKNDVDMHIHTAQLLGENVDRNIGKKINYMILYGSSIDNILHELSKSGIAITDKVETVVNSIRKYMDAFYKRTLAFWKATGKLITIMGRQKFLFGDINQPPAPQLRNNIIQMSAVDIANIGFIKLTEYALKTNRFEIINYIHDAYYLDGYLTATDIKEISS